MEFNAKIIRRGNSLGFVIPKYVVEKEKIKEGEELHLLINNPKKNVGDIKSTGKN